jgi:hypothetical protein
MSVIDNGPGFREADVHRRSGPRQIRLFNIRQRSTDIQ